MSEVADVLRKHNCIDTFSLSFIHEHFPISEDEILFETHDPIARTLTLAPVLKSELKDGKAFASSWHLGSGKPLTICKEGQPWNQCRGNDY